MEDHFPVIKRIDQGRNIKTCREAKGFNQEKLAKMLNISQQTLSKRERERELEDEFLQQVSKELGISFDYLKYHEEEPSGIIFENNTFSNNSGNVGYINEDNSTNTYHPIEKVIELCERLLKEQQERYNSIIKRFEEIEKKI